MLRALFFPLRRPSVPGEVKLDAGEFQLLLEVKRVARELGQVDRWRRLGHRARLARARLGLSEIVHMHAEVIEPVAVGIRVRIIPGALPAHDGEVDVAVGEINLAREIAVAARDFFETEGPLEKLRRNEGIFRRDCDVSDFAHAYPEYASSRSRSASVFSTLRPSRAMRRLRSQHASAPERWPSSPTSREMRITVSTRGLRRLT